MKKIAIANWKMNPLKLSDAKRIATETKKLTAKLPCDVVLCPPLPFFSVIDTQKIKKPVKKLQLGAQDVSVFKEGAFTGEVGATMLRSAGASYVIVGHSERRTLGDTSDIVSKKAAAAHKAGLTPVICIGEKERTHDGEHWALLSRELHASLMGIIRANIGKTVIAYEPIWAIGKKGKDAMDADSVSESVIFIKKILAEMYGVSASAKVRIIYGGSVEPSNAVELAGASGVSGFLVGHESLKPAHFAKIAASLK